MVSYEAQISTLALNDCSFAYDYIKWYFRVLHFYMTPNAPEDPPRPTHKEILEEKLAMAYHIVDMLSKYQRIMDLCRLI